MNLFDNKVQKKQFLMVLAVFLANGMLALSVGSLLPFIRDSRGLDYAFCGLIVSLHSVGNLVSSFVAGALPMLIGRKKSILVFEIFFPISFLLIIFGNNNLIIAFAFFATGLARGASSNYCNTKINAIATGKAWALNGLHAMFAVGAFLFPLILMVITQNNNTKWVVASAFLVFVGVITWMIYFLIPEDEVESDNKISNPSDDSKKEFVSALGFFNEPIFYLCTATLFFYLCAEQGVIGWMITYFKDTGLLEPNVAQITASVLWIMILCGRLCTAYFSTKIGKEKLLPFMGLGIVCFFVILIVSSSTVPIMLGIMGFGFSMSGIYATTVSFAGDIIKKYSMTWSFMLTFASLGSILMPSIIGFIAENAGIAIGMTSVALVLFIDMICILALVRHVHGRQY